MWARTQSGKNGVGEHRKGLLVPIGLYSSTATLDHTFVVGRPMSHGTVTSGTCGQYGCIVLLTCDRNMRCNAATIDAYEDLSTNEKYQASTDDKAKVGWLRTSN